MLSWSKSCYWNLNQLITNVFTGRINQICLTNAINKCYRNENYLRCYNNPMKVTYRTWTSFKSRNLPFSIQFPCWEIQLFQILRRNYIVTNVVFASISHTMSQLGIHSFYEYWSAKHYEVYFNIVLREPATAPFVMQQDIVVNRAHPAFLSFNFRLLQMKAYSFPEY